MKTLWREEVRTYVSEVGVLSCTLLRMVSQAGSETLGCKEQDVWPPTLVWCKLIPAPGERSWHQEICQSGTHRYCCVPRVSVWERGKAGAGIMA